MKTLIGKNLMRVKIIKKYKKKNLIFLPIWRVVSIERVY